MSIYSSLILFKLKFVQTCMLLNRGSSTASHQNVEGGEDSNTLLCRFVIDGSGKRIGESIGLNGDILIIKEGARFLGVPLKHIEEQENTLLVKGLIDFRKAYELGEQWQNNSTREFPDGVENEDGGH